MNRKQTEKKIIQSLTYKASELQFELYSEDYSSRYNHIVIFQKCVAATSFYINLRFILPNYLALQIQFYASNKVVDDFCNTDIQLPEGYGSLNLINCDMDDYFSLLDGEKKYSLYITDDSGYNGVNIDKTSVFIFDRYFLYADTFIIPKASELPKLESIINSKENFYNNFLNLSPFCFPIQSQIIGGVALAMLCKKNGYKDILAKCLSICEEMFQEGEDQDIDCVVSYLKRLSS